MTKPRTMAAFDFDGTIVRGDSLLPFLVRLLGSRRIAHSILLHSARFGLVSIGKADRDLVKEKFIAHVLQDHPEDEIRAVGRDFARQLMSTRMLDSTKERITWHRQRGHELIMVSATLDVYLEPFCELMGFESLLCRKKTARSSR